jgi:hypothetical protein
MASTIWPRHFHPRPLSPSFPLDFSLYADRATCHQKAAATADKSESSGTIHAHPSDTPVQLAPAKAASNPSGLRRLVTGRQTSSSSRRRRNATSTSSPRLIVPPVVSPQWAQHAPAASQSARLLSSPQDPQCINVSICVLLFSCTILTPWVGH